MLQNLFLRFKKTVKNEYYYTHEMHQKLMRRCVVQIQNGCNGYSDIKRTSQLF